MLSFLKSFPTVFCPKISSSAKLPLDSNYDLEQQFILRMTDQNAADNLSADIDAGVSFKVSCCSLFYLALMHIGDLLFCLQLYSLLRWA